MIIRDARDYLEREEDRKKPSQPQMIDSNEILSARIVNLSQKTQIFTLTPYRKLTIVFSSSPLIRLESPKRVLEEGTIPTPIVGLGGQ